MRFSHWGKHIVPLTHNTWNKWNPTRSEASFPFCKATQELKSLDKAFCWARKTRPRKPPLPLPSFEQSRFAWDQSIRLPHVWQSIFQIFLSVFLHEGLDFHARTTNEFDVHFALAIFFLDVLPRSIEGIEGSIFYSSSLRVFHMEQSMSIFFCKYFFAVAWRLARRLLHEGWHTFCYPPPQGGEGGHPILSQLFFIVKRKNRVVFHEGTNQKA